MPTDEHTQKKIDTFKKSLSSNEPKYQVQRSIIFGSCDILSDDQYLNLRTDIADQFEVHPNDVLVVGSAKLGFSIAPHKRYAPFGEESDIDIVIVNSGLFDKLWHLVYKSWKSKALWTNKSNFQKYLFRGWIRPDFFPPSQSMDISNAWWEYFRQLTESGKYGPYKLAGAVYKNWEFIEQYQIDAMTQCKELLE